MMIPSTKLILIACLSCLIYSTTAQKIKQCMCSDIAPCKQKFSESVNVCIDQCKSHASKLGADYGVLRQCFASKEHMIKATIQCEDAKLAGSCARVPGNMVNKRFEETLKLAAMSEMSNILQSSGVLNQVKPLMGTGKKFYGCVSKCMKIKSGNCQEKLKCGLDLPTDTVLVQQTKQCAIQSGFNTGVVRELCNCAVKAGVRQLAGVCDKIVIQ
uniref:Uncharacterized protein n=1 Tax=Rhabditophanes sp. KR3021 TaxID=114890 RepID=A0AC35TPR8_9BILA